LCINELRRQITVMLIKYISLLGETTTTRPTIIITKIIITTTTTSEYNYLLNIITVAAGKFTKLQ